MQQILLFGAGKSATSLIRYLIRESGQRHWELVVADSNRELALSKTGGAAHTQVISIMVEDEEQRDNLIQKADIVISLLPPALHYFVALSCLKWKKHLLTASYLDDRIRALAPAIKENDLLFLCEMGLDPGIDHMSAMQLIHRIREEQGRIIRFRSHTGGLVSPRSDDNPWHYKISWNPRNVVLAGSAGASYREDHLVRTCTYETIFDHCNEVVLPAIGPLAWYPNRDSLSYIPLYGLEESATFIRTTLRYPAFCRAWKSIVRAGLTNDRDKLSAGEGYSFSQWSAPIRPYLGDDNREQLEFLGLFDDQPIPPGAVTSADVLQYLLETRLAMHPGDKDMIVMLHEITYAVGEGPAREVFSSLIVEGEDHLQTAMAKTVGLPLGIAAGLILEKKLDIRGLQIPILPEIYLPVLEGLAREGVRFEEL